MGDEDPVMPVGDNVTFENTYMQKPEEFGEVRPSYSTRARRTRFGTSIDSSPLSQDAIHLRPIFGTNEPPESACAFLTHPSSDASVSNMFVPTKTLRRGTSSCAARFRKS
jgi:hypothetical protein